MTTSACVRDAVRVPRILIYHTYALYSVSETRFYTPQILKPAKASEGRFVANRMEDDAVMRRVSRDLYANPAAGLRELLANEITAARAAKKLGADPRIEVTLLDDRIVVWGVDSLGIERRIFDDVYTVLGRSGNFDGTTPGQFGLGRAAYVTLSDHMLLETRHRNGDCYTVLGVEGRGFQVDLGEPDIPYGTRITLNPREDNRMPYYMKTMVERIAGRCEIPIILTTEDGTERFEMRRLDAYGSVIAGDLPDAEYAVSTSGSDTSYLCGMPITFQYRGKYNVSVAVDIRDERKYMPTPDRERMTEEAEEAISRLIDAEIESRMGGFPQDVNEALAHPARGLAIHLGMAPLGLRAEVRALCPNDDIVTELGNLPISNPGPFLACRAYVGRAMDAVRERFPGAVFVKGAPPGLTTISEFMKRHGIRQLPPKKASRARPDFVTVHTNHGPKKVDPADPPERLTVLRVADGTALNGYRHLLHLDIALTIYDVDGAVDADGFVEKVRSHRFHTSRGAMTGGEIIDSGETVRRTARRAVVDGWSGIGAIGADGIVIWDDGTGQNLEAFTMLRKMHGPVEGGLQLKKWTRESVVEAFLAIRNPTVRRLLVECEGVRRADLCDEFLAMEGGKPVPHDDDCECRKCGRKP